MDGQLHGRRMARRSVLAGLVGTAAVAASSPQALAAPEARQPEFDPNCELSPEVRTAGEGGQTHEFTMYAVALPDEQFGYGLTPETASIPGPTVQGIEGDTFRIRLVNTTDRELSLHPHGVDYTVENDGTPHNNSTVPAGEERTYVWRTHRPGRRSNGTWRPGSAGYWNYHDHAMGTPHGTVGIRKGLYGGIVIRRTGDLLPDRQNVVVFNDIGINNKRAAEVPNFQANLGDRVEWLVVTHGDLFHTFHVHAHRWVDNRVGYLEGPEDNARVVDNVTVGPGDSFGFQHIAGEGVGPGRWMYHCHVQSHADVGMVGDFIVNNEDGTPPPHYAQTAAVRAEQQEQAESRPHPGH